MNVDSVTCPLFIRVTFGNVILLPQSISGTKAGDLLQSSFQLVDYSSFALWSRRLYFVGRSGVASCGVLGRTGALCVAAAVKIRDALQFRNSWAVGATDWLTNKLFINTYLAGVHRNPPCNALPPIFLMSGTARTSCPWGLWEGGVCQP